MQLVPSPFVCLVTTTSTRVAILQHPTFHDVAERLAQQLSLAQVGSSAEARNVGVSHLLSIEPYSYANKFDNFAISIQRLSPTNVGHQLPLYVDFVPRPGSKMGKRLNPNSGHDLMIKAVGTRRGHLKNSSVVWDLTAGLGQDSLLIAQSLAQHVCMIERDPIVATLLADGLRRLMLVAEHCGGDDAYHAAIQLKEKLSLHHTNAMDFVRVHANDTECPDIVYLDPMFPPRSKKAAVKKPMQILHSLLSSQQQQLHDDDEQVRLIEETKLFHVAFQAAKRRVVVKRPIKATPICDHLRPSYSVAGSTNRWDVYVKY